MTPLVSITIPTFDRPHYLKEAIDSALAQTYRNIEVLVFDNGTLDKTLEVRREARYEIPKYDGDLGIPTLIIPLEEAVCRRKIDYLCRFFSTQRDKHWFSEDAFLALMRLRGVEYSSRYAEAFHCRK